MGKSINWIDRNNRNYLKDVLPLETPYSIQIETIKSCNFKCNYCAYSNTKIEYNIMSLDNFKCYISGLDKFNSKIKNFVFSGLGEPLLHKNIYNMIPLVKEYSDIVTLITNGSMFNNKENIDKLLSTYIDEVRISLQGITSKSYQDISKYNLNFDTFVSNLEYFAKNKNNTKLAVKIADISIPTKEEQKEFYNIFEEIADYLIIQKISPLQNLVDYNNIVDDTSKGIYFEEKQNVLVCPQPFYSMQILVDGSVVPCCSLNLNNPIIGNLNEKSIYDIWNGEKLKNLRVSLLKGNRVNIKQCMNCTYPEYQYNKYDDIDSCRENLVNKYE